MKTNMVTFLFAGLFGLMLVATGCDERGKTTNNAPAQDTGKDAAAKTDDQGSPSKPSFDDVKKDVGQAMKTSGAYAGDKAKVAAEAFKEKLAQAEAKISELGDQAAAQGEKAMTMWREKAKPEIDRKVAQLKEQVSALGEKGEAGLDKVKAGADKALAELSSLIERTRAALSSDDTSQSQSAPSPDESDESDESDQPDESKE